MVTVGHQKPGAVRFDCVLETGWHIELCGGRIGDRERADIGNHSVTVGTINAIDPDGARAADVRPDERDQRVGGAADERYVDRTAEARDHRRRQSTGERRDLPRARIDAQDSSRGAFSDI